MASSGVLGGIWTRSGALKGSHTRIQSMATFFHGEETRADSAAVTGKVRFNGTHPDLEAFKYLKRLTGGTDLIPRQSIPAPAQLYSELFRDDEHVAAI